MVRTKLNIDNTSIKQIQYFNSKRIKKTVTTFREMCDTIKMCIRKLVLKKKCYTIMALFTVKYGTET